MIRPPLEARNAVSELAEFCSAFSFRHLLNLFCCRLLTPWLSHLAQNMRTQSTGPSFPILLHKTQPCVWRKPDTCFISILVCGRLPSSDEVRPASSKESCCAACHSTSGCKAGVFVANQCWLKFNLGGGKVSAPGVVSCKLK